MVKPPLRMAVPEGDRTDPSEGILIIEEPKIKKEPCKKQEEPESPSEQ